MQKETDKFNNSDIMEGMPSISALIKAIEGGNNDRTINCIYVDKSKQKSKSREIAFLSHKAKTLDFGIELVDGAAIDEVCVGNTHGGIIAFCSQRTIPQLSSEHIKPSGVYYMLDGVEDPYNFGYAIRSLYASGADGIILSPRNWMGAAGVVARSSAGTSELINMYVSEPTLAVELFKKAGYSVVCAGIRNSVSLFDSNLKKPLFVIIGGEKRGISSKLLELCDKIVRIDYGTEFNGSLSTAASAAVIAFEILRTNK